MRISKNPTTEISIALNTYRQGIDELLVRFNKQGEKDSAEIKKHRDAGEWTDIYTQQMLDEALNKNLNSLRPDYEKLNKKARETCQFYLAMLKRRFDQYFTAGVRPEFAGKIDAYKATGVTPSKKELELLVDDCVSFPERQILKAYIVDLGKPKVSRKQRKTHNDAEFKVDEPSKISLADYERYGLDSVGIDEAYRTLDEYTDSIHLVLNHYCGTPANQYIYALTGNPVTKDLGNGNIVASDKFIFQAVNASNYWDRDKNKVISDEIDRLNELTERKTDLTASERDLLHTLLSPFIVEKDIKKAVQTISDADVRLASLIEVSPEYSKYLDD